MPCWVDISKEVGVGEEVTALKAYDVTMMAATCGVASMIVATPKAMAGRKTLFLMVSIERVDKEFYEVWNEVVLARRRQVFGDVPNYQKLRQETLCSSHRHQRPDLDSSHFKILLCLGAYAALERYFLFARLLSRVDIASASASKVSAP